MKLQKLLDECIEALNESAYEDFYPECDLHSASAKVDTNNGQIYVSMWKNKGHWECDEVIVYHNDEDDKDGRSINFETWLAEQLDDCIDEDAMLDRFRYDNQDEWQEHGFRDEADFWRWKEGR